MPNPYSLKNNLQRPITETKETAEISQRLRTLREKELAPLEEIYTGPYQPPAVRDIRHDDNYLEALSPGVFVAVYISNYKKKPVTGKVTTAWQPLMVKSKEGQIPWNDTLPKQSVIVCSFELDEKNYLFENTRKFIKRWYREEAKR
ncbi:Hypothetical predicted protein, partial [Paramuricea clavata]